MKKHALLTEAKLEEGLNGTTGWTVEDGKWLTKKYLFGTFKESMAFANKVADIAEEMNHHPFLSIDFRKVTVRLTTWSSGGLTALDISSIKAYDQ